MHSFTFNTTKALVSEIGAIKRIGEICRRCGIQRPLIVTDPGIEQLGLLTVIEAHLREAGLRFSVFAKVIADPPESVILEALATAKIEEADGIIGFGGGSSMDTAKLVALMACSGETLAAIYGVEQAKGQRLPLIQIPTTAGTGSEVTAVAIVTTSKTTKMGVVAQQLLPDIAVLDAELTLGLPPNITAMTGIDAMVHAVEAYTSIHKKNAYSDMLAREALRLLSTHIYPATHNGGDVGARQAMLLGACLAGQAFANAPVAAVHALAYPLGGHYHIPHGLSNSLVLPHVLRFNHDSVQQWYGELAQIVIPAHQLTDNTRQLADYFVQLIDALELPSSLAEVGVPEADLPILAAEAMQQQRLLINNPRELTQADALAIYRAAYR